MVKQIMAGGIYPQISYTCLPEKAHRTGVRRKCRDDVAYGARDFADLILKNQCNLRMDFCSFTLKTEEPNFLFYLYTCG